MADLKISALPAAVSVSAVDLIPIVQAGVNKKATGILLSQITGITGLIKGDGTNTSAAVLGTDYSLGTAALATGILKSTTGTGDLSIAVAGDFPTLNQNTTGSAATLTTGRTIAITGDLAYTSPSFNGSGNVTAAGTLATVNSNVGTFGSVTKSVTFTVNAKGLVTAASEQTLTPAVGSITGLGTGVATFLATPSSANLASALTDEQGSGQVMFNTNTASTITDAATMDIASTKNTLSTSSATRTFTISYTGDDIIIELTLNTTSSTFTFPATALCISEGVASGNNTLTLTGTSGDKYIITVKKIGSIYYVASKNWNR